MTKSKETSASRARGKVLIPEEVGDFVQLLRFQVAQQPEGIAVDFESEKRVPWMDRQPVWLRVLLLLALVGVALFAYNQFQGPEAEFLQMADELKLTENERAQVRPQFMAKRSNEYVRGAWAGLLLVCVLSVRRLMRTAFTTDGQKGRQIESRFLRYLQLDKHSDAFARGLGSKGVSKGDKVLLLLEPSPLFVELVFGLLKLGAVPCFINPRLPSEAFAASVERLAPTVFVGSAKAHLLRLWHAKSFSNSLRVSIVEGSWWFPWGPINLDTCFQAAEESLHVPPFSPNDPAAIITTSGSTGMPKGVVFRHGSLVAQARAIQQLWGVRPDRIDNVVVGILPFMLYVLGAGVTAVMPSVQLLTEPAKADPDTIVTSIRTNNSPAAILQPVVWDNLVQYMHTKQKRPLISHKLRIAVTGGAPIRLNTHKSVLGHLMPTGAEMYSPYGATEVLPISSMPSSEILAETWKQTAAGNGVCVGRPLDMLDVKIIAADRANERIEQWDNSLELRSGASTMAIKYGEIVVRGPVVSREYDNMEEQTALAKIPMPNNNNNNNSSRASGASSSSSSTSSSQEEEEGKEKEKDGATERETEELDCGFYHRTGDVGYFDTKGRLWYCGRVKHLVSVQAAGKVPVPAVCVEGVFNEHPRVRRCAFVQADAAARIGALVVQLNDDGDSLDDALVEEILALAANTRYRNLLEDPRLVLRKSDFPTDIVHNSKIKRTELAEWAAKQPRFTAYLAELAMGKKDN